MNTAATQRRKRRKWIQITFLTLGFLALALCIWLAAEQFSSEV